MFERAWQALERAGTVRAGDRQLLARWNLAAGGQRQRSAAMNALQMSQFYQWLSEPRLGAFVICVEHPQHWLPMMRHIDFAALPGTGLEVDGVPLGCYVHDSPRSTSKGSRAESMKTRGIDPGQHSSPARRLETSRGSLAAQPCPVVRSDRVAGYVKKYRCI